VNEKQAIAQLKRGDLTGLEVLVGLYQLQAVRAACLVTGDLALSKDIVQNVFIRVAGKIDQFNENRSFGPWFIRSVINDAIKATKYQKRFTALVEGKESDEIEEINLVDSRPQPEEVVENMETSWEVWRALKNLSPSFRAVIVLRYYLEMGEGEMADALHCPVGTVKWRLYSARHQLAKLLSFHRVVDVKPDIKQEASPVKTFLTRGQP